MQRPTFPRGLGLASGTSSSPFLFPGMWGAGRKGKQRHVNILQPLPIHSLRRTGLGEEKGGSWRKLPSASIRRCHEPHFKPGDTTAGEGGGRARGPNAGRPHCHRSSLPPGLLPPRSARGDRPAGARIRERQVRKRLVRGHGPHDLCHLNPEPAVWAHVFRKAEAVYNLHNIQ